MLSLRQQMVQCTPVTLVTEQLSDVFITRTDMSLPAPGRHGVLAELPPTARCLRGKAHTPATALSRAFSRANALRSTGGITALNQGGESQSHIFPNRPLALAARRVLSSSAPTLTSAGAHASLPALTTGSCSYLRVRPHVPGGRDGALRTSGPLGTTRNSGG